MKYGDTLRQRSTPEWAHYNIDYDYLKDLIKHQTTSGTSKALSIPGQGESSEKAFGGTFYRDLKAQHDRINLFVRSKSGEIQRRLEHIHKSLKRLQSRRAHGDQLPASIVEKFAKIDADVNKAGEEIRALSRFQVAQRTGFRKILKKYKRWTKDAELERRFRSEVTSSPTSFYQLDLGYLLDQYIEVLGALRAHFDAANASESSNGVKPSSPTGRIAQTCRDGSELDFDVALSLTPLGSRGNRATYWIHPDHIVEAEVLLLQHMRLIAASSPPATRGSPEANPLRRISSATTDRFLGSEDGVGLLVLDHPESFAIKQNASSLGSGEDIAGTLQVNAAGNARWTSSGDAALALDLEKSPEDVLTAKLDRKHLPDFLDTSVALAELNIPSLQESDSSRPITDNSATVSTARNWLEGHKGIRPIVGISSKRTRLMGLHNNDSGGMWATLDRDVFMNSSLHKHLGNDDWMSAGRAGSITFPHAILEIRKEGAHASALIQTLDRSHLVERVRGFSLQAQAVWACCRPTAMSAPIWIPLLEKDIRKLPPTAKRERRKANSTTGSSRHSTFGTPGASTGSHSSPSTPLHDTSATSAPEFVEGAPPLRAFRKKRKPSAVPEQPQPEQQRYWNEYDNPEDEDEGYYIYIDPDAEVKFPGQELFEGLARQTRRLFGIKEYAEEESSVSSAETSDDEDSPVKPPNGYGTFGSSGSTPHTQGYFSGLFRKYRDPQQDVEALLSQRRETAREHRSLLRELEVRRHKAETTKLYFYTTCLAMALIIDALLGTMAMTSRKKEVGVVDFVVSLGTIVSLILGVTAIVSMQSRRENLGWAHRGVVYVTFTANVVVDILFFIWVFRGF
ncbi:SPX-domain-containing protein [Paraphaeosphaeria sporulosa]|uniref:SPX-domain-containing protein n=1 Tax=Paraphaeosphaeria sporulosa TaxID=1460663 RepID=A0A177CKH5_9PLEO|nr:SPX-domain-containing protein [Paraphaeosphaeria sporulosa]OAG07297.1 SPX-domain-containing protein [Paraphaeosphaeria sporulosa]